MPHPDVLIVGAGLAGLAAAAHLRGNARVMVVDQGPHPASEATAQGVGMARRLVEDPVDRALAVRTVNWLDALDPPWSHRSGAVVASRYDATWINDAVAHLTALGIPVEPIDEVGRLVPAAMGGAIQRGWWLPSERIVEPVAMVNAFLHTADAEVRCGVRVTDLAVEGGQVVGVNTTEGRIGAGAVVLAAGAWCSALAARAGIDRPVFPLRRTVFRVPAPPPPASPWLWVDDIGLWARPAPNEWWVSPCDEAVDFPAEGPGSQGKPHPDKLAVVHRRMAEFLPGLPFPTEGWTGLRSFSPDRRPLIGSDPALPGLWWAAGLGGSGVTLAPAIGEALAAWMRGLETPWLNPRWVAPDRPSLGRWPIRPDGRADGAHLVSGRLTERKTGTGR